MECTKKELIIFTIVNFLLLVIAVACVICMEFNVLSLVLATISLCSILTSSYGIWKNAKELKKQN